MHDIYGTEVRVPYSQVTEPGKIGALISKCTEVDPLKRPSVGVLRSLLLESTVSDDSGISSPDQISQKWLAKLDGVESWTLGEIQEFGCFFESLDIEIKQPATESRWVTLSSTPFLTRLSEQALEQIVGNQSAISKGVIEKYCNWVKKTEFEFNFADLICSRLCTIFDNGSLDDKARSFSAMVYLGYSHNRWYVMRCLINRCRKGKLKNIEAERLALELRVDEYEYELSRCLKVGNLKLDELSSPIAQILDED